MNFPDEPQRKTDLPPHENLIEEYKTIIEDRRFVMSRYMQALSFYLALVAFTLKEMVETKSTSTGLLIAAFVTATNVVGWYASVKFKSMALHSLERESILADKLGMQWPHSIKWGYYVGMLFVLFTQLAILAITVFNLRSNGG